MWKDVMDKMGLIGFIAYILLLVGGIGWGFIGLFEFNILRIFDGLARLVYLAIGASAGYLIYMMFVKKKAE